MFDISHRALLTNLAELDRDIYPFFSVLMVTTLVLSGEALVVLEGMQIIIMII